MFENRAGIVGSRAKMGRAWASDSVDPTRHSPAKPDDIPTTRRSGFQPRTGTVPAPLAAGCRSYRGDGTAPMPLAAGCRSYRGDGTAPMPLAAGCRSYRGDGTAPMPLAAGCRSYRGMRPGRSRHRPSVARCPEKRGQKPRPSCKSCPFKGELIGAHYSHSHHQSPIWNR
jgi:hypothetical protein